MNVKGVQPKATSIIVTIVVIVLLLFSCSYNGKESNSAPTNQSNNQDINQNTPNSVEEVKKDVIFSQGDKIVINSIDTQINGIEVSQEINTSYTAEKTDNQYILISLTLTNTGKTVSDLFSNDYTLVDDKDREYEALDKSLYVTEDEMLYHYSLNPGLSITKMIAFETPKGVHADKLKVYNDEQFLDDVGTYIYLKDH